MLSPNRPGSNHHSEPVAGSHGMAMLYLATPSLQPLCDGLVKGAVEGFY
jgi:hypothetical protein